MPRIDMLKSKPKPVVKPRRRLILWIGVPMVLAAWGWAGYRVYERHTTPLMIYTTVTDNNWVSLGTSNQNGMTDNDLYDEYDLINSRYFEGKLPNAVLRFVVMPGYLGLTQEVDSSNPIIHINPELTPSSKEVKATLLHEICHTALKGPRPAHGSDHGKEFQACMRSLAARNAFSEIW